MRQHWLVIIVACMLFLLAACSQAPTSSFPERAPETITRAEAEEFLRVAYKYAQANDMQGLCGMVGNPDGEPGSMCADTIRASGWAAVPAQFPTIVDDYVIPDSPHPAGGNVPGGRIMVLEGTDGLGKHYRNEYMNMTIPRPGPVGTESLRLSRFSGRR